MTEVIAAGAGFLLAVLWFDLMFDVQVLRRRDVEAPEAVLASIAGYYGRVLIGARPMNRLVALVMLVILAAIAVQIAGGDEDAWVGWLSLALAGVAIGLAAAHTVPAARRLGSRDSSQEEQGRLARSILRDHLICLPAIVGLLAVQLAAG